MRRRQCRRARTSPWVVFFLLTAATVAANRTCVAQAQRLEAVSVNIVADGKERQVHTAQMTVGAALKEAGIHVNPADWVSPKSTERIKDGMTIKVVRVEEKIVVETQPVAFKTVRKISTELRSGMTQIAREGKRGEKHLVYSIRTEDGIVKQRKLLNTKVVKEPEDKVLLVGAQGLMTSRGFIQPKRTLHMRATAYDPGPRSCGKYANGRTCTGMRAGYGVVAVDPRVIKLGSRLYIEGYGFAIAGDRGSAIKGHKIDLGYDTYGAARRFGRRMVKVHILR